MGKYLDGNGLSHFMGLVKTAISNAVAAIHGIPSGGTSGQVLAKSSGTDYAVGWVTPSGGGSQQVFYGTCNTTASTTAKVVTCSGWTLAAGNIIGILFTTANTAATPTLNVNSTTAKSIYVGNSIPNPTTNVLKWSANTMVYFMYDGTYYRYICAVAAGSIQQPDGAGHWYGTCDTATTTAAKTSAIANFRLTPGAIVHVKFANGGTYETDVTLDVNSTGAKSVKFGVSQSQASTTYPVTWANNSILEFIYDGTNWLCMTPFMLSNEQTAYVPLLDKTPTQTGVLVYAAGDLRCDKPIPVELGGTGAGTATNARANLDVPGLSTDNTFAGRMSIKDPTIDRDGTLPSSDVWATSYLSLLDKSGEVIGCVRNVQRTSGRIDTFLYAYNEVSGTGYDNYIRLGVARDGTCSYYIKDAAAFRDALGFNTWTTVSIGDFATAASGWAFATNSSGASLCNIQYNAALGVLRCRIQVYTSAAQTAGQKTVFTVKAAYRPKTFQASLSSLTSNAQAIQIYTTGGGAVNISAINANTNLYFNGVYFIGA